MTRSISELLSPNCQLCSKSNSYSSHTVAFQRHSRGKPIRLSEPWRALAASRQRRLLSRRHRSPTRVALRWATAAGNSARCAQPKSTARARARPSARESTSAERRLRTAAAVTTPSSRAETVIATPQPRVVARTVAATTSPPLSMDRMLATAAHPSLLLQLAQRPAVAHCPRIPRRCRIAARARRRLAATTPVSIA